MPEDTLKSAAQEAAEADVDHFRKELGPFVVAAEKTRMAMIFMDAADNRHPIIFVNDSFLELTGFERQEVLGQSFDFLIARGTSPDCAAKIRAAFIEGTDGIEVLYRCKDGRVFCSAVLISPVKDERGDIVQHFASFVDITTHRQEQAHSTMLIDELNHRVKNTLATVQAIVSQGLRNSTDLKVIKEAIETRIFALSRSHDLLTREKWEGAGLRDLVNEALEPFSAVTDRANRVVITGENIRLAPNAALALGIGLHELATNAAKYGAFSNDAGSILVSWSREKADDRLILSWREKDGPPVTPPTRKGFGSRVLERGLAHELGGIVVLDYPIEGVVCTISFLTPRAERNG